MSYSKTYTGSVPYSGTVSYSCSYPASEHGGTTSGTVHYSGSVPVSVNLYVNTDPFDSSVANCSQSVRTLNGAVIAMNSAQVASIMKSANEISNHISSGFFNMINSELGQNIVALVSKFKAMYEFLTTQSSILQQQQIVMHDDYDRISERYTKFFLNLDEELEKRVIALDKNVFEISKRIQGEQLHSEASQKVTQFLIGVNESEILQQQLIIATGKARVIQAMDKLAENVVQETTYLKKVNSILAEKNCSFSEDAYIPVIYTESSNLNADMLDYNCFSNPNSKESVQKIDQTVKSYFASNYSHCTTENEAKQIDEAFALIAEREFQNLTDEKSVRIYEMLTKLKES